MQKNYLWLTIIVLSVDSMASDFPIEFTDFFTPRKERVLIAVAGDNVGQQINAEVTYESFRLLNHTSDIDALRLYLESNQLTEDAIESIVSDLSRGVPADPGCKVALNVCKPLVATNKASYVFDVDNNNLVIYIGSKMLARSIGDVQYQSAARSSNALVNEARLYSYFDAIGNNGFNSSNSTTLGLPYGYLHFNTQYQSADNQFDLYKGVYDFEFRNQRAVLGYSKRENAQFNSTDFLVEDANYSALAVQIGSSRNLIKGGAVSLQKMDFFAPQAGQLEVYQGDRLLLSNVVSQGRQSISYGDLPAGAYDVKLVLKAAGKVVVEEYRQVVNTQLFSLPVGGFDYVLTAGRLDDIAEKEDLRWHYKPEQMSPIYGQIRTSWRLSDGALLAGALTSNQDDLYAQFGINFTWSDWLQSGYQVGQFSSDDYYQSGSLNIGSLYLSARRFDSNNKNRMYRLSTALYDEQSYSNYSATYSSQVFGGSGYITYSHYDNMSPLTQTELAMSGVDNISTGWVAPFMGGSFGVNTTYSKTETNNDLSVSAFWSYSFDGNWSSQWSLASDRTGVSRGDVGVTRTMGRGRWTGAAIATTGWSRDLPDESSFSGIVNGATDWFNGSAYGYVNNTGQQMISGTLTGTQFLSADGFGMSNDLSSSFIRVVPDIKTAPGETDVSLNDIHYNIRKGKRVTYQGNLGDSNAVIALEPYIDTEFVMDAETKAVDIEVPIRREFVYPGTVYTIDTRVTPLVSQLFVLNDLKGNPIQQARCVGSGCQSVERLSDDGVFRVNYRRDGDIKLMSMNSLCINSPELSHKGVVYTYCLPGLDDTDGRVAFSHSGSVSERELLYLGKYPVNKKAKDMLERLKSAGLTTRSVELGHYLYIYVQHNKEYTVAQRALLEDMDAYIVRNEADFNELFSGR